MHPSRTPHWPAPPTLQSKRRARLADAICATATGVLFAVALVHWWSCEGVC